MEPNKESTSEIKPGIVENPEHEKLINMLLSESMTEARLEGKALDAVLAQIDKPTEVH